MKTIICQFKSEGIVIKKTAILNDSLDDLSKSKKNEADDILGSEWFDYVEWSIIFHESDSLSYEVVFKYDDVNDCKTLKPLRAITWGGDDAGVVIDVQRVSVTIR